MDLKLYDTLTREKRVFTPLDPANVRMYVCGPTVYDFAHIGNARPVIVFDVLFRLLRHLYGPEHVTYVRNITDVDDKINARAAERLAQSGEAGGDLNAEIRRLTEETYANFKTDVAALGCLPPTVEPRATEYIRRADGKLDMITLIERLIENGNAYTADGHVLFHVPSMADYGRLSKRPLDEMIAGARVEVAPYKRDPMDFVLWKPSKPEEPGWDSPWGHGRPGWHIECSAMSGALLGQTFDIHGGGIDLVFPHHENEIAQSRSAFHTPIMANYWMHNGFLMVEGEKMAKSLGNFITIREALTKLPGDVIRLQMLMTHYHQPIDWTETRSELARNELEDWAHVLQGYYCLPNVKQPNAVVEELLDDLNTPNAIVPLRDQFSRAKSGALNEKLTFAAACQFLGFRQLNNPGLFQFGVSGLNVSRQALFAQSNAVERLRAAIANNAPDDLKSELIESVRRNGFDLDVAKDGTITLVQGDQAALRKKIEEKIATRLAARKAKNFKEADRIRDELLAMGVVLKDGKDGTTWEVAR
jgi:cysteinyl-tRNA synthetase